MVAALALAAGLKMRGKIRNEKMQIRVRTGWLLCCEQPLLFSGCGIVWLKYLRHFQKDVFHELKDCCPSLSLPVTCDIDFQL